MNGHKIVQGGIRVDNKKNKPIDQSSDSLDTDIAKLAFLGATLTTIGDGITAIAAGMALQQLEDKQSSNSQAELQKQVDKMQKQIDQLTYKMERLDRKTK